MPKRILIVGAGPTGLTAALELARRGIIPTVIEKRAAASNLSRAVGILPASMDLLTPSGAAPLISEQAIAIRRGVLHHRDKQVAAIRLDILENPEHRLLGLPQDKTEMALAQRLVHYGGGVNFGAVLETIVQDEKGIIATINGETERFDYAIGADGVGSMVRQKAGIAFSGYRLGGDWSIADVEVKDWPYIHDFASFLLGKGKVVIAIAIGPNRIRVVGSVKDALAALPVQPKVIKVHRQGEFAIDIRQAAAFTRGCIALAGDAAHCHSPFGGRGMNLGIADACALAECLAEDRLESYAARREAIASDTIRQTERMRRFVMNGGWAQRQLLFVLARLVGASTMLNRRVTNGILGLS